MRSRSPHPTTIAKRREQTVCRYLQLKTQIGSRQAARQVGRSPITLWRWQRALAAQGLTGLVPRFQNSGLRSKAAKVPLSAQAIQTLENLLLQSSQQKAWEKFQRDPACPPALAALRIKTMPAPVERLVKLKRVQIGCKAFVSADGRRVFLKLKGPQRA